jgi:hypothetical protein
MFVLLLGEAMAQKGKYVIGFLAFIAFVLFVHQNAQRAPSLDAQGGYLSLDLYYTGFQLKKPIGVSILMCISFLLGMFSCALYVLFRKK